MMLISIIVPLYNAMPYIDRLMDCLLNQSYKHIEIILYDDASNDNTRSRIFDYQEQYSNYVIRIGQSDTNSGIGAGKNFGIKEANGEYLMFIDQDDYIDYTYVQCMVNCLHSNPDADIIISGFTCVDIYDKMLYIRSPKTTQEAFRRNIPLWGKLYRKNFIEEARLTSPEDVVLEDVLYQAALASCLPKLAVCKMTNGYFWVKNPKSASKTMLETFPPRALDNGFIYLVSRKEHIKIPTNSDELSYGAFLFCVWHLLKCGCNAGKIAMEIEYNKAFSYLETEFPNYMSVSLAPEGSRLIVAIVLKWIRFLRKVKLDKKFFIAYSYFDFSKLWPNL